MQRILIAYLLIILITHLTGCHKEENIIAPQLTTISVTAINGTNVDKWC